MSKKITLTVLILLFTVSAIGVEANIQPSNPETLVLTSPDFQASKTFDGTASTGEIKSYSWNLLNSDQSGTGPEITFNFSRQSSNSNTIRLTVSNGTHSSMDEVSLAVADKPNISTSASDDDVNFGGDNDDDGDGDNQVSVSFYSNVTDQFDDEINYNWTIDGVQESTKSNFTYTFNEPSENKEFDVELNVTDSAGYFAAESISISVDNETEATSQTQKKTKTKTQTSGGGTGGSNKEFDVSKSFLASPGEKVKLNFDDRTLRSLSLGFSENLNESILDARLNGSFSQDQPESISEKPSQKVYRYMELVKEDFSNNNLEKVEFNFRVKKSWIENNNIDSSTVKLKRYNDGWSTISTSKINESNDYINYKAETDSLSVFAITGEESSSNFEVSSLSISRSNVSKSQNFTITVKVKNTGSSQGDYKLEIQVGDKTLTRNLQDISPGQTKTVQITSSLEIPGTYTVQAGNSQTKLTVKSSQESANKDSSGGGFPWFIFGLVFFVVLISGGVLLYAERDEELSELSDQVKNSLGLKNGSRQGTGFSFEGFSDSVDLGTEDNEDEDEDGFDYEYSFDG